MKDNGLEKLLEEYSVLIKELCEEADTLLEEKRKDEDEKSSFQGENTVVYKAKQLREGRTGSCDINHDGNICTYTPQKHVVLVGVELGSDDEVLNIPSHFPDLEEPLTHIGYTEIFEDSYEKWCDWHHPSKGSTSVPARYVLEPISLNITPQVKKIVIPETVREISPKAFEGATNAVFEVHPDNPYFIVENNKPVSKNCR